MPARKEEKKSGGSFFRGAHYCIRPRNIGTDKPDRPDFATRAEQVEGKVCSLPAKATKLVDIRVNKPPSLPAKLRRGINLIIIIIIIVSTFQSIADTEY